VREMIELLFYDKNIFLYKDSNSNYGAIVPLMCMERKRFISRNC
jgi:hypothetical protein